MEGYLNFKAATNPKAGNRENSYSDMILATCARHDIPLTAVNVRTSGEKLGYAKELLEQRILGDPSCPKQRVRPVFVEALIIVYPVRYRLHIQQVLTGESERGGVQYDDLFGQHISYVWA